MNNIDEKLKVLYKLTLKASKLDEIAVGAIVILNDKVIGKGFNNRQKTHNVCGHAEINAIKQAEKYVKDWRLNDCVLISTLKPCNMCAEVINTSRIKEVYYLIDQDVSNNNQTNYQQLQLNNTYINKITKLFNESFKKLR